MSFQSGIFNSTEAILTPQGFVRGNKAVDASFFANIFKSLFTNGVFLTENGGGFACHAVYGEIGDVSALSVTVSPGACHIGGYFAFEDEAQTEAFAPSASGSTYVHRLRLDLSTGEITRAWVPCRDIGSLFIENATGAGFPLRNDTVYDLLTARVDLPAGCTLLEEHHITDLRTDPALCGIVAGAVTEIDTQGWSRQMQAYIASLKEAIASLGEGDIAAYAMTKLDTDLSNLSVPLDAAAMEALAAAHTHGADRIADGTLGIGVKASTGGVGDTFRLRNIAWGTVLPESAAGIAEGDIYGVLG